MFELLLMQFNGQYMKIHENLYTLQAFLVIWRKKSNYELSASSLAKGFRSGQKI